jgi:formylmethanofuran dehydrogenase subunit E
MVNPHEWLEFGQKFHGHKCPAMPMGLRVGAAAMNALGVERAKDGEIVAFVELGEDHCATCYADGLQVIMGTTFGKGNIKKTQKGKWAVTLVDKKSGQAVRVTPKAEAMLANKQTSFFKDFREKDIPASSVPHAVVDPLVVNVMNAPEKNLLNISDVFNYNLVDVPHSFSGFVCEECGEMTVEEYGRIKGNKKVCIDCAAKRQWNERSASRLLSALLGRQEADILVHSLLGSWPSPSSAGVLTLELF